MQVDLTNNTIVIDDPSSQLKPSQITQLNFWGFNRSSSSNKYSLSLSDPSNSFIKLLEYFDNENIKYSLSDTCQKRLSEIRQKKIEFERFLNTAIAYKNGSFDVINFEDFVSFVSKNVTRNLRDHQLKAAYHLYLVKNGANFSVPGSGKTTVVLSVYGKLKRDAKVNVLFVIGPPACFGPWKVEFKATLGYQPTYKVLSGGDKDARKMEYFISPSEMSEMYLSTFQTLLNDRDEFEALLSRPRVNAFLVIDEAHYIKQIGGSWANAILQIAPFAKYRCILTGTPLPKSYSDIYNLIDFLWPDNSPLTDDRKIEISLMEERGDYLHAKENLKRCIDPIFYRVRKTDLGLRPPIFHPPIIIQMNKNEKILYDAIVKRIKDYSKEDYLKNIDLVNRLRRGRIMRLRQCVSYAKLLSSAIDKYGEDLLAQNGELKKIIYRYDDLEKPAKLKYLLDIVKKLKQQSQKVVIWSHFRGTLQLIHSYLMNQDYCCKLIYGGTPIEQTSAGDEETREKIRNEFVDPDSGLDILIANPAACAESISLHKTCFHAIYYDLSYNCAQYLQSLDRIHRVGGSEINQANYYFLQYENSIDQDILNNINNKADRMYSIIDDDCSIYSLDMFEDSDDEIDAYKRLFA